eukprot:PhM_4_TR14144/c3_g1_i1/m.104292
MGRARPTDTTNSTCRRTFLRVQPLKLLPSSCNLRLQVDAQTAALCFASAYPTLEVRDLDEQPFPLRSTLPLQDSLAKSVHFNGHRWRLLLLLLSAGGSAANSGEGRTAVRRTLQAEVRHWTAPTTVQPKMILLLLVKSLLLLLLGWGVVVRRPQERWIRVRSLRDIPQEGRFNMQRCQPGVDAVWR